MALETESPSARFSTSGGFKVSAAVQLLTTIDTTRKLLIRLLTRTHYLESPTYGA